MISPYLGSVFRDGDTAICEAPAGAPFIRKISAAARSFNASSRPHGLRYQYFAPFALILSVL
ncbi:hypothetical protein [Paraburkholderia sp. WSM4179]|uniref:hypothetical protein n=1 Tax=unclassified Paraburkholderia TaxID=2615204 RepID=UPI002474F252|nr:hypothetical protein [Paraburkholderia sp. WSM4179]MDH6151049.1 hypothetical protein [Paraburkholderia sp. WSM4179]